MLTMQTPYKKQLLYSIVFFCFIFTTKITFGSQNQNIAHAIHQLSTFSNNPTDISPTDITNIFDTKKTLSTNQKVFNLFKSCKMLISPAHDELIIGSAGTVYSLPIQNHTHPVLKQLFKHPDVDYPPILDLTQQEGELLVIASAGNFRCEDTKTYHSHLEIYLKKGWSFKKRLDWPVQNLKFDQMGNKLAIAGHNKVALLEMKTCTFNTILFEPAIHNNVLRNITISPEGRLVIAASEGGQTQIMSINKEHELHKYATIYFIPCPVKQISYPDKETIMIGSDHNTYSIKFHHLLGGSPHPITETPLSEIASTKEYKEVTLNSDWTTSSAHWTKKSSNIDASNYHVIKIFIATKCNSQSQPIGAKDRFYTQEYTLTAPSQVEKYKTMTKEGLVKEEYEHILNVAFNGNLIVALLSSGKLITWKLPELQNSVSNTMSTSTTTTTTTTTTTIPQSTVEVTPDDSITNTKKMTQSDSIAPKKISPRLGNIFASSPSLNRPRSSSRASRGNDSPRSSLSASPSPHTSRSQSPREKKKESKREEKEEEK